MTLVVVILVTLFTLPLCSSLLVHASMSNSSSSETTDSSTSDIVSSCVTFDSEERTITITCKNSNLTHIDNQLNNSDIIRRDDGSDEGWILDAGITVAENATLYINSSDTSWLKI